MMVVVLMSCCHLLRPILRDFVKNTFFKNSLDDCSLLYFLKLGSHLFFSLLLIQGLVGAPACGDVMKLQIQVDDDGTITDSKFKTFGCGSAIASSSVATEWVKGKQVDEVLAIKNGDIAAHLKLPPVKLHCSMLAEDAIKSAVADWKAKQAAQAAQTA
jgi:Fe-S cluster assembly scaffold IscU